MVDMCFLVLAMSATLVWPRPLRAVLNEFLSSLPPRCPSDPAVEKALRQRNINNNQKYPFLDMRPEDGDTPSFLLDVFEGTEQANVRLESRMLVQGRCRAAHGG